MNRCPKCGGPLKPLFSSLYCPCDGKGRWEATIEAPPSDETTVVDFKLLDFDHPFPPGYPYLSKP